MTTGDKETILIAEDAPKILLLLRRNLEKEGYKVITAQDGETALNQAEMTEIDLMIVDIGLPRMSGFEVCRRVREFSTVPIIILTALDSEADKVKGLVELGADDYQTKPFNVAELLARVKAVLRRTKLPSAVKHQPVFVCGEFTMNVAQRRVMAHGKDVKLSPTEYKLLYELVTNAGKVVQHQDLLARVWGREYREETEYLRVYVRYLRQKIEADPSHPKLILTESGVGYRFAEPDPAPAAETPST